MKLSQVQAPKSFDLKAKIIFICFSTGFKLIFFCVVSDGNENEKQNLGKFI